MKNLKKEKRPLHQLTKQRRLSLIRHMMVNLDNTTGVLVDEAIEINKSLRSKRIRHLKVLKTMKMAKIFYSKLRIAENLSVKKNCTRICIGMDHGQIILSSERNILRILN